jgi:hypothetical protein
MIRQKQIVDGANGSIYYEINFTVQHDQLISTELYEELHDHLEKIILADRWTFKSACKPSEPVDPDRYVEEYGDAITDLTFLYDLLRVEGHDPDGKFMKGIRYAYDYLTNKQK